MYATLSFVSLPQGGEMVLIFIVILLLFGAKKLPQLARGVGKSMGEFKRAREEFEHEITRAEHEETSKSTVSEKKKHETEA
ncbi:MAG: twin-arginine translocase TatA/TatE family subunit [Rubritalea sp.]|uniref:Sec-independent protein translocase subunit TatA/TatB n=1 Tax=Rubritalea sp. TaxID=2109375 RepID=UPI0032427AE9